MTEDREGSRRMRRMAREAAKWVVRCDAGLTPSEQDAFLHWLASDARHRELHARYGGVWNDFDALARGPYQGENPHPGPMAVKTRLGWIPWSLAAVAAGLAALIFWRMPHRPSAVVAAPVVEPLAAVGGPESHVLADGSIVSLNRGTAMRIRYTPAERQVELLRGEGRFQVAKNPLRPFIVRAGGVEVRAVGTAFDVRLGERAVEVLVTDGRVQVKRTMASPGAPPMIPQLAMGERAMVPLEPGGSPVISRVSAEEVGRLFSWQPQLLDFTATPLARVVAAFNQRNRVRLVIADPALDSLQIDASFRSDNVDGFVRLLEATAGIRAERSGDAIVLRRAR